jgi:type II restriction enzyme
VGDIRKWGMSLRGTYNALKPLTEHDFLTIETAIVQAKERGTKGDDDETEEKLGDYRHHLQIQYKISEWGIENGYRVHVAINDKGRIREKLKKVLLDIPRFHSDRVLEIAEKIYVLFFDKERDVLTHAFEVEHTPTMYSGLLRLNDIAETCHRGTTKFFIISDKTKRDKFNHELERPSFQLLRLDKCEFVSYEELEDAWKQLQTKSIPLF